MANGMGGSLDEVSSRVRHRVRSETGDYESELRSSLCHCWLPRGRVFLLLIVIKSTTHWKETKKRTLPISSGKVIFSSSLYRDGDIFNKHFLPLVSPQKLDIAYGYLMSQDTFNRLSMGILSQTRCVMLSVYLFIQNILSFVDQN